MSSNQRSTLESIWHHVSGRILLAPGEVVSWVSGLSHARMAWGSIGLAALLLLSSNLIVSRMFRDWRADFTQEKLFTISPATRSVLAAIDEPITLRMYFSRKLGEASPQHLKMFERVRSLLEQYASQARGKIELQFFDPEPFSEAEDRAQAGGLSGQALGEGDKVYFGLVAQNRTDQQEVLEFFSQERERFLEYDLTKLVHVLSSPKKRVVGLISSIPVDGGGMQNPMMPPRRQQQPLIVVEQMKEFFEVKTLAPDLAAIPADVDVLMLIQPSGLSKQATYAIDQFALKGGRILAFVDPNPELAGLGGGFPGMMMGGGAPVDPDFINLMKTWGIDYDPTKIATDFRHALRLESGTNPGWFSLGKESVPELDVLAADVKTMLVATPGVLSKAVGATTDFQPLLQIVKDGAVVPADRFPPGMVGRHSVTEADLKPLRRPIAIAARVAGVAKSAFPEGRPKAEAPKEENKGEAPKEEKKAESEPKAAGDKAAAPAPAPVPAAAPAPAPAEPAAKSAEVKTPAPGVKIDTAPKSVPAPKSEPAPKTEAKDDTGSGRPSKGARTAEGSGAANDQSPPPNAAAPKAAEPPNAPKADDKGKAGPKDAKQAPKAAEAEAPHLASGSINVVVIADTDFLQNPLWVDVQQQRNGQLVAMVRHHNGGFVINALENLAGGAAFLGLRGRGISDRPFDTVEQIKREAERRYQAEENRLKARVNELTRNLANVTVKGDGQVLLSEKENQAIENFKAELAVSRRRLREAQLAQRQDINNLHWWLMLLNIAAMPLIIGAGGIALMMMRRRTKPHA